MTGPLAGIHVVDVTEGAQGPWAGALLADMGAEVIKIEKPSGEMMRSSGSFKKGHALPNMGLNHGKRAIILDLKIPEDHEIALELIARADIFLENWRPGVAERLGLDYAAALKANPRIVYCSCSGFGQTGAYAGRPCVDTAAQALGGFATINGPVGGPAERARFIAIDLTSPLPAVQAMIMALLVREETGEGQWVQCSQLETTIALQAVRLGDFFANGASNGTWGSGLPNCVPAQAFQSADAWINVDCSTQVDWGRLCGALGLEDLVADARFATNAERVKHRAELVTILNERFMERPAAEWLELLTVAGVPCGSIVTDIAELYEDPQILAQDMLITRRHQVAGDVTVPAVPWHFSRTPAVYGELCPPMGQHTDEVLAELRGQPAQVSG